MIKLTDQDVINTLAEIVSEYGDDHVYEAPMDRCVYVHGGQPSCLVGKMLHKVGIPLEKLEKFDLDNGTPAAMAISCLMQADVIDVSSEAIQALSEVQSTQDAGYPWGVALQSAKSVLSE